MTESQTLRAAATMLEVHLPDGNERGPYLADLDADQVNAAVLTTLDAADMVEACPALTEEISADAPHARILNRAAEVLRAHAPTLAPISAAENTESAAAVFAVAAVNADVVETAAAAAARAEAERKAAEKKAEAERKAAEKKAEAERKAAEKKAEAERKAAEKKANEARERGRQAGAAAGASRAKKKPETPADEPAAGTLLPKKEGDQS